MKIVCYHCGKEDCNRTGAQHFTGIDDFLFLVADNEQSVRAAFEDALENNPSLLETLSHQTSGIPLTIEGLTKYVMQQKQKWNQGHRGY